MSLVPFNEIGTPTAQLARDYNGGITNENIAPWAAISGSKIDLASSITSAMIVDGTIVNADINASAAVAVSKLAAGTSAQVLLNTATPTPTWTTLSGDVTVGATGVTAIGAAKVTPTMMAATAWTAWTSTWTASSGTAPSIGNGTVGGRYTQLGKTVIGTIDFQPGSTTTFGDAGVFRFTLPVAPKQTTTTMTLGSVTILDAGTALYMATVYLPTSVDFVQIINHGNTGAGIAFNTPMTWADADSFQATFTYEAA